MHFYSHAREGRDNVKCRKSTYAHISTHTPARGVTTMASTLMSSLLHFYSHAREGRDTHQNIK